MIIGKRGVIMHIFINQPYCHSVRPSRSSRAVYVVPLTKALAISADSPQGEARSDSSRGSSSNGSAT